MKKFIKQENGLVTFADENNLDNYVRFGANRSARSKTSGIRFVRANVIQRNTTLQASDCDKCIKTPVTRGHDYNYSGPELDTAEKIAAYLTELDAFVNDVKKSITQTALRLGGVPSMDTTFNGTYTETEV